MPRILIIDDSEALLAHISQMLLESGHDVFAFASGETAITALRENAPFDLVLTDLYMPPPDGFEILAAKHEIAPQVPLIVMSTNPLACDVFRAARALGAVDALQKPFTAERLNTAINAALSPAGGPDV